MSEFGSSRFGIENWERHWDPRDESEWGDEDEEAKPVGGDDGLVDDEVNMENKVVAERIGQYSVYKVKNEMTKGELENLRLEYGIPDTIELRLLRKNDKASQPPNGSVLIHPGGALITNNPSKKAWKNKYAFATGNWEFREGDLGFGARVQTCFRRAGEQLHVM
ncbi:unnamed protein product [Prunus armeniaca]|uniref:Uncharacterized protein n=1 Tax=Prunus armeniaca TaxID=36596 RepID=A0A6J5U9T4_PRUAR|nr:unnamed protein product [Prunus armeniaca]